MLKIIKKLAGLIVVVAALLLAVEEDKNIEEEKEKVKESFVDIVEKYGEDFLPDFLVNILTEDYVIDNIIELKLWAIRRTDFLQ